LKKETKFHTTQNIYKLFKSITIPPRHLQQQLDQTAEWSAWQSLAKQSLLRYKY
jgi:hypothetical protein